jgi:diphosphomevalonate decarboxylase
MEVTAIAHPNIALIKYWGKSDVASNLPAVGSISITLDTLTTTTHVRFDDRLEDDEFILDGRSSPARQQRVRHCLDLVRHHSGTAHFAHVRSDNSFPTAAGLASSASGFAALVTAADRALGTELGAETRAELARRCSGSAARSIFGGYVELTLDRQTRSTTVRQIQPPDAWPLEVVIAVTSVVEKKIGSTEGMELTAETSPYYAAWVDSSEKDLREAHVAIESRDFEMLATVSEQSCLKMHATALAARPGLVYWNGTTVACIHLVRELRQRGTPVFFTIDAGPQVKAICTPEESAGVAGLLADVPGVVEIIRCGLGDGARVVGNS